MKAKQRETRQKKMQAHRNEPGSSAISAIAVVSTDELDAIRRAASDGDYEPQKPVSPSRISEILKDACVSDNLELQLKLKVAHNNEYPRDKKGLYQETPVQPHSRSSPSHLKEKMPADNSRPAGVSTEAREKNSARGKRVSHMQEPAVSSELQAWKSDSEEDKKKSKAEPVGVCAPFATHDDPEQEIERTASVRRQKPSSSNEMTRQPGERLPPPPLWHDGAYERRAAEERRRQQIVWNERGGHQEAAGVAVRPMSSGRRRLQGPPSEAAKALRYYEKKQKQRAGQKCVDADAPPAGTKSVQTRRPEHRFAVKAWCGNGGDDGDYEDEEKEAEEVHGDSTGQDEGSPYDDKQEYDDEESEDRSNESWNVQSGNVSDAIAHADATRRREAKKREIAQMKRDKRIAFATTDAPRRRPTRHEAAAAEREQQRASKAAQRVRDATDLVSAFKREKSAKEELRLQLLEDARKSIDRKRAARRARFATDNGDLDRQGQEKDLERGSILGIGQGASSSNMQKRRDGYDSFDRFPQTEAAANPPLKSKWVQRWAKMALRRKDDAIDEAESFGSEEEFDEFY